LISVARKGFTSILGFRAREEIAPSLPVPNLFWKPQIYLYTLFFFIDDFTCGWDIEEEECCLVFNVLAVSSLISTTTSM
jgi:hypothetical protein